MLEKPKCELGYPIDQVAHILGTLEQSEKFGEWIAGQTIAICDGRQYNHETHKYEPTHCGPHGPVIYAWDLKRFLDGRPIVD